MALDITFDLRDLQPAGNESYMIVSGDTQFVSGVTDYRYITDIYTGETLLATLKAFPDPNYNTGLFNLQNVVAAQLTYNMEQEIDYQAFHEGPNSWLPINISVGEEYFLGSAYVVNRNIIQPEEVFNFWNAALPFKVAVNRDYDDWYYGANGDGIGFMQSFPIGQTYYYLPQYKNTQFRSWLYYFQDVSGVTHMEVSTYGSYEDLYDDSPIGIYQIPNPYVDNPGVQFIGTSYVHMLAYNVREDVVAIEGDLPIMSNDVLYYTVRVFGEYNTSFAMTYRIYEECTDLQPIDVYWLNEMGGFDSWRFYRKTQTLEKEKATYKQIPGILEPQGTYDLSSNARSNIDFYTRVRERMTIQTLNVDENQMWYLKGLFSSPVVFIEENGVMYSVNVDTQTYKLKKIPAEQIYNLSIDLVFSIDSYRQIQ